MKLVAYYHDSWDQADVRCSFHEDENGEWYKRSDIDPLILKLETENAKWMDYFRVQKANLDLLEENARLRKFIQENIPVRG
jgi:hypothetical protein